MLAHTAGNVGNDFMPVLELHPEHGVGKGLANGPFKLDDVVFSHKSTKNAPDRRGERNIVPRPAMIKQKRFRCSVRIGQVAGGLIAKAGLPRTG